MKLLDLSNQKFGRLTVVSRADNTPQGQARWNCLCDCGSNHVIKSILLRRGISKSCGCLNLEVLSKRKRTHGHTVQGISPTFHSWAGMMNRCTNPSHRSYQRYGGRGITVCERWHTFQNFLDDMGVKPIGLSLDRKDNSLPYTRENCRWATASQQARNKSTNRLVTANGETKCVQEWAGILNVPYSSLAYRLDSGWGDEATINKPFYKTPKETSRHAKSIRLITYKGETKCVQEWTEITGLSYRTIHYRLNAGWSATDILTKPSRFD